MTGPVDPGTASPCQRAPRGATLGTVDARSETREFLTSRRARLTPDQAGLRTYGGRRRVPGLRREEVALLAGVSADYYTRLERGNLNGVSETVLEALARALQLDDAERAHLFDLARATQTASRTRRRPSPRRSRASSSTRPSCAPGPACATASSTSAHRGETFALDGRPGAGFWLRVLLPDGRTAYALGDEVQPFAVNPNDEGAPVASGLLRAAAARGVARRARPRRAGCSASRSPAAPCSASATSRRGRRSSCTRRSALEGFVGDGLTSDGTQLLYGGGVAIYLAPSWPVCPFVGLFGGGLSVLPNADSFVLKREDLYVARAGGGILLALRNRILVRLEATNLSLFTADSYKNAQTYAGGLGVYF